jgi:hypothetical protein
MVQAGDATRIHFSATLEEEPEVEVALDGARISSGTISAFPDAK